MAKQQIKRFNKFKDVPGLDKELDTIIGQIIKDLIGVLDPAIGEVYINDSDPVVVTITTPGTYYLVEGFELGENNKVELLSKGMRLQTGNVNNTIVHMAIFANNVVFEKTAMERKIGTAADFGAMGLNGYGVGNESTLIQLKVKADKACNVTINHMNWLIKQVL
jgi:hypothetical protein